MGWCGGTGAGTGCGKLECQELAGRGTEAARVHGAAVLLVIAFVANRLLQMQKYCNSWPLTEQATTPTPHTTPTTSQNASIMSEYNCYRLSLVLRDDDEEGWPSELRRYLKDMLADVTKDTDIVVWWQVSCIVISNSSA